jgi:hypothetical protein
VSEIDAPTRTADDFVAKGDVNAEMIKRKTVGNLFNSLILRPFAAAQDDVQRAFRSELVG